ncbi:ABC transporter permease [Desulfoluna spongiiphila]|uniref:Putative ABC transport system permease protein n=1 Tax=Desulfoluna spongiiphila TaxID=419481 RepID=A0A1G5AQV8_9BACT|nr:ABC transporter permease [Desulfoluna spongiiphila]SCX80232.1 putative ABC transport system permease protein [Desulfoluna spongiiphila]
MFDADRWREVFGVLNRNRLRTLLTGFSVAWGIFILIVLLGAGTGLENGLRENFKGEAMNAISVYGGFTQKDHGGVSAGREIRLAEGDPELVRGRIRGIGHMAPVIELNLETPVRHGSEYGFFSVEAVCPENRHITRVEMTRGRYLNSVDMRETRKTAVVDDEIARALFGKAEAVGQSLLIGGIPFTVVGVFKRLSSFGSRTIYIPFATGQRLFQADRKISGFTYLVDGETPLAKSRLMEAGTRVALAGKHRFDPSDKAALMTMNSQEESIMIRKLFTAIRLFLWITGIGTLIAGIVGISNIMLITVRERTREIGIRKAVGATPASVVGMVVTEAVLITVAAGYTGLVAGVATLELVQWIMAVTSAKAAESTDLLANFTVFLNPTVDFGIAVKALLLLSAAGVLAGFFPARRAALVKPIEAMRE